MRISVCALLAACVLGGAPPTSLVAQQPTGGVAVRVTDQATGRPLEGARVQVTGTNVGGQTNADGRVALRAVPAGAQTLRVLRVGFGEQTRPVTIAAGQTADVAVALRAVPVNLAPVITTATGEQRRVEIGNATSNIDAATVVQNSPVNNLDQLLNSRAPGVQVASGSQTGTGARIRIRGMNSISLSNEPIWIIDGIRMTSNNSSFSTVTGNGASGNTGGNNPSRVGDLNPEEIESIEIVKGPSAATLYGTDAANGVIVVTTKKGRAGETRWNAYAEGGILKDQNPYPTAYTIFGKRNGAPAGIGVCNLQRVGTGECTVDSVAALNLFKEKELSPIDLGNRKELGLQVSGGSEALRYFSAVSRETEQGVLSLPRFERQAFDSLGWAIHPWTSHPNTLEKNTVRLNVNTSPTPKLDLGVTTSYANVRQRYSLESNSTAGLGSQAFGGPGTTGNGTVTVGSVNYPKMGYRAWTPGLAWQERSGQEVNRLIWSAQADWRPYAWLRNHATAGQDFTARSDDNLLLRGEGPPLTANTRLGSRGINRVEIANITMDLGSTASWNAIGGAMKSTLGAQYVRYNFSSAQTGAEQLAPGSQNVGSGSQLAVGESNVLTRTLGAFFEQSAAFRDRLFLTAAVRSDQNSAFGTNFQRVFYPKASASYIISDEPFWKAPDFLNSLRLRLAYGQSGVQPGPNDAIKYYTANTTNLNNSDIPIVVLGGALNPNLKPERSTEVEGGFEARLFNQRVSLDATYYSKVARNSLIDRILPPSYGSLATQITNLGKVKNAGVEAVITAQLLDRAALAWDLTVSGSANDNKVVSLGDTPPQVGTTTRIVAGYPISGFWARPITGWEDKNGDGLLTYFADPAKNEVFVGDSVIFRGYSTPRYSLTFSNGFDLLSRALRLQLLVDYRGGNKWYNNTERIRCTRPNCAGRMSPDATFAEQATNIAANEHPARTLDGFFQSGAFWRLREASLAYTLPDRFASSINARSASIVLSGRNLWKQTKYRGVDPELGFNLTSGTDAPSEFQTMGPASYYIVRLNLGF
ncbi:MAG TPA: SusC/RagA family TonB-linked outer membrane protein [Gemmatimonadaceae bacterium]